MNGRAGLRLFPPIIRTSTPLPAEPIHRLLHERGPQLHATPNLGSKLVEPLRPKYARGTQSCGRQRRSHCKLVSGLQRHSLVDDSKIPIELFELAAHQGKAAVYWNVVGVVIRTEELSEGGLNERRFARTGTLGRRRQPRGHLFGEVDANSGFHRWPFEKRRFLQYASQVSR